MVRLLLAIFVVITASACFPAKPKNTSFRDAALGIVSELRNGSLRDFSRHISHHGLIVIDKTFQEIKHNSESSVTRVWKEETTQFGPDELSSEACQQAIRRFRGVVDLTPGVFPTVLKISVNLLDHQETSYLGPAIAGKYAANAYWYIRFVRENGQWKVWCLEEIAR